MFTGLVTDVGRVRSVEDSNGLRRITIDSAYPVSALQIGASVQHSGVCLTLVEFGEAPAGSWWKVEAVPETLLRTTLSGWMTGSRVNLELSLKLGDELGGHLVYGHVDGLGIVRSVTPDGDSRRIGSCPPVLGSSHPSDGPVMGLLRPEEEAAHRPSAPVPSLWSRGGRVPPRTGGNPV
jgi:riboflavin synthase